MVENLVKNTKSIKTKKSKQEFNSDTVFYGIVYALLIVTALIILYPLWYIFISSFSSGARVAAGEVVFWPLDITLDGYKAILDHNSIPTGFKNTFIYTVSGTVVNVIMTVMAAYALSRTKLPYRNQITLFFAFTMWFNGGMIPTYLLYKDLHLIDNPLVMIIPGALGIWNMVITRTFFQKSIPNELLEAATMDGCSDIGYLLKIVLPLSKPIIAVITLYYAVGHWNAFFNAMIYLHTPEYYPLQLIMRDILIIGQNMEMSSAGYTMEEILYRENLQNMLQYSVIVVSTAPMLILYPFVQKYFVQGIMVGALKG